MWPTVRYLSFAQQPIAPGAEPMPQPGFEALPALDEPLPWALAGTLAVEYVKSIVQGGLQAAEVLASLHPHLRPKRFGFGQRYYHGPLAIGHLHLAILHRGRQGHGLLKVVEAEPHPQRAAIARLTLTKKRERFSGSPHLHRLGVNPGRKAVTVMSSAVSCTSTEGTCTRPEGQPPGASTPLKWPPFGLGQRLSPTLMTRLFLA